jgi:hypothetical protein
MRFDHDTLSSRIMAAEERRRELARMLHAPPDPIEAFHARLATFRSQASALHARLVQSRLFDGEMAFLREQLFSSSSRIENAARGIELAAQRYRADFPPVRRKVA